MQQPLPKQSAPAWRQAADTPSLPEVYGTINVPTGASAARKMLAFAGPGYLIAVGYMDPGNWATDIAGGSAFGYTLLAVILLANLMAILLQALSAKLGIVTSRDLAQACRDHYSKPVALMLWVMCEIAICACDLAEVIGTAIALNLLFGIPMIVGVCLTVLDVFLLLLLQNKGFRYIEAVIISLIIIIGLCFAYNLALAQPDIAAVVKGFIPTPEIVTNPAMLFIAMGILGATVMPHNLYLHSSIVQTRKIERSDKGIREAIRYATIDSTIALMFALFINAAILIVAAAVFHEQGKTEVTEIQHAYHLLAPLLGVSAASILFGIALLASGQNSTLTATLAGQIVMEGFLSLRLPPWIRRLLTRLMAIVPAVIVTALYGDSGTAQLLILSQVILSMQLPFAVIPLVLFTSDKRKMGVYANPRWIVALAWTVSAVIVALNIKLLTDFFSGVELLK
jgi:manganese transport protein